MNREKLLERMQHPEWTDVEFKEARRELPKSIWETVSAFANTDGGHIVLGIKELENGRFEPVGVEYADKIQNDFITTLRGEKFNIQMSSRGELITMGDKTLVAFKIAPMPRQAKPVYFNNDIRNTFVRLGSTDQRCGKDEIKRMLREASEQTSDSLLLEEHVFSDADMDTVAGFRRYVEAREPSHPFLKLDDSKFLTKIGAMRGPHLTVAGLLLFGKEDRIFERFPSFELSIYHMPDDPDSETRWNDRKLFNQNIVQSYIAALAHLKQFIPAPFKLDKDGITRLELVPSYITIREAMANLLMHRDYFDSGIAAVRLYSDRIVFRNPGASLLSMNEMLHEAETAPRNPVIARAFRLVGWAETAGSGILKMKKNWQAAGFPAPVIRNNEPRYWFTLELGLKKKVGEKVGEKVGKKVGEKVTANQARILNLLKADPLLSAKDLASTIGISLRKTEENLAKLKAKGLLDHVGPARGGRWAVKNSTLIKRKKIR